MNALATATVETMLQLGAVVLLCLAIWFVAGSRSTDFARWIGLYPAPRRALLAGLGLGIGFAALLSAIPAVHALAGGPKSVPGRALADGVTAASLTALVLLAVLKTGLAEELLFRGLIGKRMIARFGFAIGNSIQAILFGAIHLMILLAPNVGATLAALMVLATGLLGFVNGWINERLGNGSILPGWAAHGSANLLSYGMVAWTMA